MNLYGARLNLELASPDATWTAEFADRFFGFELRPGYYGDLRSSESFFHDVGISPVMRVRGLGWCSSGEDPLFGLPYRGWFVIDSITYDDQLLAAVELRFEQRCEGATGALRGKLRWVRP